MHNLNFAGNSYSLDVVECFDNGLVAKIKNFDYKDLVSNDPFGEIEFCDGTMTITNPNGTITEKVSGKLMRGHDDVFVLKHPI